VRASGARQIGPDGDEFALARHGMPWLTAEKLKSLGFPVSASADAEQERRHNEKLLPKDVYVVLELNGESYQAQLNAALNRAARDEALATGTPANEALADHARSSRRTAEVIGRDESRLYCIDAGLDAETNVPLGFRRVFGDARSLLAGKATRYEVSVAWGRRLEPWIVGASARSN
jgi:hypothetical protein